MDSDKIYCSNMIHYTFYIVCLIVLYDILLSYHCIICKYLLFLFFLLIFFQSITHMNSSVGVGHILVFTYVNLKVKIVHNENKRCL